MKKFEEEFDKNVTSVALRQDGESVITVCDYNEAKAFGHDWVSPEDHQNTVASNKAYEKSNLRMSEENAKFVAENIELTKEIAELKSQIEKQQPELPEFVAEFIKNNLDQSKNMQDLYDEPLFHTGEIYLSGDEYDFISWLNENTTLFEKAWTSGYTIKEKLYKVVFPKSHSVLCKTGEVVSFAETVYEKYLLENAMTESEIKAIDERYWAFAAPVEEDA
jgi:hypothetical protein